MDRAVQVRHSLGVEPLGDLAQAVEVLRAGQLVGVSQGKQV